MFISASFLLFAPKGYLDYSYYKYPLLSAPQAKILEFGTVQGDFPMGKRAFRRFQSWADARSGLGLQNHELDPPLLSEPKGVIGGGVKLVEFHWSQQLNPACSPRRRRIWFQEDCLGSRTTKHLTLHIIHILMLWCWFCTRIWYE